MSRESRVCGRGWVSSLVESRHWSTVIAIKPFALLTCRDEDFVPRLCVHILQRLHLLNVRLTAQSRVQEARCRKEMARPLEGQHLLPYLQNSEVGGRGSKMTCAVNFFAATAMHTAQGQQSMGDDVRCWVMIRFSNLSFLPLSWIRRIERRSPNVRPFWKDTART